MMTDINFTLEELQQIMGDQIKVQMGIYSKPEEVSLANDILNKCEYQIDRCFGLKPGESDL